MVVTVNQHSAKARDVQVTALQLSLLVPQPLSPAADPQPPPRPLYHPTLLQSQQKQIACNLSRG